MKKNYKNSLKHIAWGLAFTLWLPGHAYCQPALVTADFADHLGVNDVIRLKISENISTEELQRMVLELDAIDVTAMIQRDGEYALYKPLQPLKPGRHELRVVENGDDGSILELGFWSFNVRQSKLFREYAAAADTQLTGSYRMADNTLSSPKPNRITGQGSSQMTYSAANGDWRTTGSFDLLFNSENGSSTETHKLDNGEFLFTAGNTYIGAAIGHQNVGTSSLAMDNFRRRGVSLQARVPIINSQISAFSLSSEAITGFQKGLGVSDADNRVDGITFASSPFKNSPQALYLSGTWLDGQGQDSTGMVASITGEEPGLSQGRAWSVSADSLLWANHLRLRAEYASSDYDFSTTDTLDSEKDNAYSLLATFSDSTTYGMNWNTGIESREIGTFFKSMANQSLPSDRHLDRVFGGTQWSTMGLQASYERQTDNVNDLKQLPRIKTELASISQNWSPQAEASWLGAPSMSTIYSQQRQKQTSTPSGFLLPPTDNELKSLQISSMFSYTRGNWGLTLGNRQFRDQTSMQDDTDTNTVNFDSGLMFMQQRINLSPSVHFDRTNNKVTQKHTTALTYGLQSTFVIKPNKLDGSLNISLNRNRTTDDIIDDDTFSANMAFNWHFLASQRNRPGLDAGINGMYNNFNDNISGNTNETFQAFLTLSMVLPSRAGQAQ